MNYRLDAGSSGPRGIRPSLAVNLIPLALVCLLATSLAGCSAPEVSHEGRPPHVDRRHVRLEGAKNFRDLGGYATDDGRSVRWGLLYRSGQLSDLTPADQETLRALDIHLVCDFRSADERESEPSALPESPGPSVVSLPISDESFEVGELRDRILSGELEGIDMDDMLVQANRSFAGRFAKQYRAMFERLRSDDALPALVHCTAGKDRAGFASAVFLRVLGVPEETVFEDYLLTNHYLQHENERMLSIIRIFSLFRTDPEEIRPLFEARREYLRAAFDAIAVDHGSFDAFRREALGLEDADVEALRSRLLENAAS